jgi:hypothetical protein
MPALIAKGHAITGLTRSATKAEAVRSAGAQAAVADGLDAAALTSAVRAVEPEVVIDEMTR